MGETSNDKMSMCLTQDIKSALAILERIRFEVGPEFMRKDVSLAIKLIKSGLNQGDYDGERTASH